MAIVKNIKKDEPLKLIPWLGEATEMEKQDKEQAVKEYVKIAEVYPLNEKVYDRLMILYRQLKMPKQELLWINRAIRIFDEKFKTRTVKHTGKIASISKSLIRSTGLADKKGKSYYLPQPIARWTRRKELLEKRQSIR
jgi:hypothetical protein